MNGISSSLWRVGLRDPAVFLEVCGTVESGFFVLIGCGFWRFLLSII